MGLNRLLDMVIQNFQDEDDNNQEEIIKNLGKEHLVWTS